MSLYPTICQPDTISTTFRPVNGHLSGFLTICLYLFVFKHHDCAEISSAITQEITLQVRNKTILRKDICSLTTIILSEHAHIQDQVCYMYVCCLFDRASNTGCVHTLYSVNTVLCGCVRGQDIT